MYCFHKVHSTAVKLFEFNEALPPLQVFKKKHFGIKELPVLVFGKKKKKDKFLKKIIRIKESSILIFQFFFRNLKKSPASIISKI